MARKLTDAQKMARYFMTASTLEARTVLDLARIIVETRERANMPDYPRSEKAPRRRPVRVSIPPNED